MIKDEVVYLNSNNYCIVAIYYLRTCNKLTKAYREAELLWTIKRTENIKSQCVFCLKNFEKQKRGNEEVGDTVYIACSTI